MNSGTALLVFSFFKLLSLKKYKDDFVSLTLFLL